MSSTNTGGPAFPFLSYNTGDNLWYQQEGMTLRDYFAAKAMQGLLAGTKTGNTSVLANDSYKMADAMLKAREA
jgi:hypothetical protein